MFDRGCGLLIAFALIGIKAVRLEWARADLAAQHAHGRRPGHLQGGSENRDPVQHPHSPVTRVAKEVR